MSLEEVRSPRPQTFYAKERARIMKEFTEISESDAEAAAADVEINTK